MNKRVKNMWAGLLVLGFVAVATVGCNKYDKMSILGKWKIDLKEVQGLQVEYAFETITFSTGDKYTENREVRDGNLDRKEVKGEIERKHNKITFFNRVQSTGEKLSAETFKYRVEGDKFILIVEGAGFKNDEKIYIKEQ
jgi:hypothetical protein